MRPAARRRVAAVVAALAVGAGALAAPSPVAAAAPEAVLTRQQAWVTPGDAAVLAFRIPEPVADLEIQVSAHRAVTSRSALTRSLSGGGLGAVEGRFTVPAAALPVNAEGDRLLVVGIQGPDIPADATHIVPGRTGVYPVDIVVRRSGSDTGTRFVTPLVVVAPGLIPLTLAWVWRFDATPAYLPDGGLRPSAVRALGPGGRLARMAAAGSASGNLHLTLAPTPETLEAWAEMARDDLRRAGGSGSGTPLGQFRAAAAQSVHQVLAGPYVPADLPALAADGLTGEIDHQFARGSRTVQETLGLPAPSGPLLAGTLDPEALGRLRQHGVEQVVVTPSALEPIPQRLTPGRPFLIAGRGRAVPAAVSDPSLAAYLTGDEPPALQAARFLAALSLVTFEAPRDQRGVVVVMPPDWSPSSGLLSAVLAGLNGHPAILTATLDEFFAGIPPEAVEGQPLVRALARASGDETLPIDPEIIEATRGRVTALSGVLGPDPARARAAERALLTGQAEPLLARNRPSGKPSGSAYVKAAGALVSQMLGRVRGPDGQRVTLTARRAQIPISLLNANPEPLLVRVRLESDQLRFPKGAERTLTLPPQNTTEQFAVETRASGAFPLLVTVTSPDGALLVNQSKLTIRSTVVSGAGALLTAGAGFFLLVWWGNDLRSSRSRRRRLRAVADPAADVPKPGAPAE